MKPSTQSLPVLSLLSLTLLANATGTVSAATTIFNDTFTDGDRINGADTQDINWHQVGGTTLSVGNDAVIGAGNALIANTSSTFNRIVGEFGSITIGIGETLQLSFTMRYTDVPDNTINGFRFGIYNNGGSPFTADGQTGANENNNYGYGAYTNAGLASATGTRVASEAAGSAMLSGSSPSGFAAFGTAGESFSWGTASAHSIIYSITRLGDGTLDLFSSIDGGTAASGNIAAIDGDYIFHEIAFGHPANNEDYVIDNVKLQLIP
jgi:hypothetical protein